MTFVPFPDKSSFYVGVRNGDCDLGMGGVEMDPQRAVCDSTCQDTSVTPLTEYVASDYGDPAYNANLDNVCCVDYGVPCALLAAAHTPMGSGLASSGLWARELGAKARR